MTFQLRGIYNGNLLFAIKAETVHKIQESKEL